MKQKRTNVCQWCGKGFPTSTAHMVHVTTEHPETIGRGRTVSKLWSCGRCGHDNPPVIHECAACGRTNELIAALQHERHFIIVRRRLDGSLSRSRPTEYGPARIAMALMPDIMASQHERQNVRFDGRRYECLNAEGTRVAWLEVAADEDIHTPTRKG